MTGTLLFLLSFFGWFLFLAGVTSWPAATLPLFIVSSLIAVLYAASLADLLLPGACGLAVLGLVLGVVGVYRSRPRLGDMFSKAKEPGPVLFFLLAALLRWVFSGTRYAYWDEFSHWGFAAKEMAARNGLPTSESVLFFKDYPPGTALFQYYTTFFTGWSEGATVFAQVLLLLAAATTLLQNTSWKQGPKIAVALSLFYLFIVLFNYQPQTLCVDHVLGSLFGIAIASCLISEDGKYGTGWRILPTLFILPLVKVVGLVPALTAAAAISTNHLLAIRSPGIGKIRLGSLGLCAALLLTPSIAAKSWSERVKEMGIEHSFKTSYTLAAIRNSLSASAPEYDRTILSNFKTALLEKPVARGTPAIVLILILSLGAWVALRKEKRIGNKRQILATFFWMSAGLAVFTFGLLLLYLYAFSTEEGPRLASYARYLGVPFLAWSLVTSAFFLRLPPPTAPSRYARYLGMPIVLAAGLFLVCGSFDTVNRKQAQGQHNKIRRMANAAVLKTRDTARVYVIWQKSNGAQPIQLAYELFPRKTSIWNGGWSSLRKPIHSWSLVKHSKTNNFWSADIDVADWRKILKNYDFVLLGKTDKPFWNRYGELFEKQDIGCKTFLFKVTAPNGEIKLRPMP
jgi:hypothetical protein